MPERIVIISDTHLGRPHAAAISADVLRPLWQSSSASQFVINGDIAEVHHPHHWSDAAKQVMRLHELCEHDGVALTLLSGNHDPYITDQRQLQLAEGRVFITHGDVLHPAVAPWSPAAGRIRSAFDLAMGKLDPDHPRDLETRLAIAQHASHAEWDELAHEAGQSTIWRMLIRPWAIAQVLWYWRIFPDLAASFAEEHAPDARFLVFGHTHRPGIWKRGERTIINTGSFGFPGTPRAVIVEGDRLTVMRVVKRKAQYEFGKSAIAEFQIGE